jgi:hypothetical protein
MASHELEEMLRPLSLRIGRISSKIEAAERAGAKECSPGKVARAKKLLETARRSTAEYHYHGDLLGTFFAPAELAAEELMEERRFAVARGIKCFSTN